MEDLGIFNVHTTEYGLPEQEDIVCIRMGNPQQTIVAAFATALAPQIAGSFLAAAQQQGQKFSEEKRAQAITSYQNAQQLASVAVSRVGIDTENGELVFDVGIGLLRFALDDKARQQLKEVVKKL
jgi:hypothetical protein